MDRDPFARRRARWRAALLCAAVGWILTARAEAQAPEAPPPPAVTPEPAAEPSAEVSARRSRPSGTLRGSVVSADDETPIEGATVYVRGTHSQATAGANGEYSASLPAGTYQVSVIQPGFSTQNVSNVEVRPNQVAVLNVKLQAGSVALDEMVVVGSRIKGGIATLIAERRESKAVADVIGAEQMQRSGDSNAASALSRVTGITVIDGRWVIVRGMGERYSTMTLNGLQVASPDPTRRVVPLDIFPAGLIDSVVVQKSYSADLPGEFGGGLVQLRSRDYPRELMFNVNVATGGNFGTLFRDRVTYTGGKYDLLGWDDGGRALPSSFDDPRGKIVPGGRFDPNGYSQEEIAELGRELPRHYNHKLVLTPPDLSLGANVGNQWRLRHAKLGFVTGFGYRSEFRNILNAKFRDPGPSSDSEDDEYYRLDNYRRQVGTSAYLDWGVEFSAQQKLKFTTMLLRQTDDTTQLREDQLPVDGQTQLQPGNERTTLQWVEREVWLQQVSGKHVMQRLRDFAVDWRYAFGQAKRSEPNRVQYIYVPVGDGDYEIAQGAAANTSTYADLKDLTHEAQLDLSQPFGLWRRLKGKLKLGGLFYRRDRTADTRAFEYNVSSAITPRTAPPDAIFTDENIGNGIEFRETTRETDSYDSWMQIEAGYATLDLPLHRSFDLAGGARLEHAHIESKTFNPFNAAADPVIAKLDNLDVLPSVGATWRFVDDLQLRAGYSRTLNRPDFRELSPSRYYDLESNLLLEGNANVKRAIIDNFDLRLEWYHTPDEVFSLGGFAKRFDDPIETKQDAAQEVVYTVENADQAISYGLELEGRKRFGFITDALNALYLACNVMLIGSEVGVDYLDTVDQTNKTHHRPLQGQSPWVVNAQLGWDDSERSGFTASLLFNTAGKRIRIVGDPASRTGDIYELPIHRLDFVVSQNLPHKFKLGARVRNLLNARERWVQDGVNVRDFRRGGDFQISLSWSH